MTREEIKQVIKILQLNYPATYRDMSAEDLKGMIALWLSCFEEYDVEIVGAALRSYIKENEYPPTIAGLHKRVMTILNGVGGENEELDDMWNIFRKAVSSVSVGRANEVFETLPEPVKKFVGNPDELFNFGLIDVQTFRTVVRGQFDRAVKARIEKNREIRLLPTEVKNKVLQLTGSE